MVPALNFDHEAIYAALFALVSPTSVYNWASPPSRRLKLWEAVPPEQRPALFQFEGGEEPWKWTNSVAPGVTLNARLFIYTDCVDPSVIGTTVQNQILNALNTALAPKAGADVMTGRNSLGGLVQWCRIEGTVFRDPGDIDGDGMLVVPISILVNA